MADVLTERTKFLTGAFGGIAPFAIRLGLDLVGGNTKITDALDISILIGIGILAVVGGFVALIWKENDIKKLFYVGLGLPSLLTVAASHVGRAPQTEAPAQAPSRG